MSPKQRIRLTPEERITQILDAAERVFGESGFRQGSFKDVADAVGLTLQGVLHYFGTKEDLLRATLDRRNAGQVVIGERIGQEQVPSLSCGTTWNATKNTPDSGDCS